MLNDKLNVSRRTAFGGHIALVQPIGIKTLLQDICAVGVLHFTNLHEGEGPTFIILSRCSSIAPSKPAVCDTLFG